jgi:hypothetical protein
MILTNDKKDEQLRLGEKSLRQDLSSSRVPVTGLVGGGSAG